MKCDSHYPTGDMLIYNSELLNAQQALAHATKLLRVSGWVVALGVGGEVVVDAIKEFVIKEDAENAKHVSRIVPKILTLFAVLFGVICFAGVIGDAIWSYDVDTYASKIEDLTTQATERAQRTGEEALNGAANAEANAKVASLKAQSASSDASRAESGANRALAKAELANSDAGRAATRANSALDKAESAESNAQNAYARARQVYDEMRPRRLTTYVEGDKSSIDPLKKFKGFNLKIIALRENEPLQAAQDIQRVASEAEWHVIPIQEESSLANTRYREGVTCTPYGMPETPAGTSAKSDEISEQIRQYDESLNAAREFCEYLKGEKWSAEVDPIPIKEAAARTVGIIVSTKPNSIFLTSTLERDFRLLSSMDRHFGPEPAKFHGKSNQEIGGLLIEESGRIELIAQDSYREDTKSHDRHRDVDIALGKTFSDCCLKDIEELRIEGYRRLGTATMDPDEADEWNRIVEDLKGLGFLSFMDLRDYSKQLYKLGQRVEVTR